MYEGFDPKVKSEVIVISGLNNYKFKGSYGCYNYSNIIWNKKVGNPNKSDKEIEAEIKKEIKINIDKLKEESIRRYYKIAFFPVFRNNIRDEMIVAFPD